MPVRDLIVAADFGTTSVKLAALDRQLRIVAEASAPCTVNIPAASMAEQAPQDIWNSLVAAVRQLHRQIPDLSGRVAGMSIAAQMCGLICTDEAGTPLRPALVWLDKRSARIAEQMVGGFPSYDGYGIWKLLQWLRLANGIPSRNGMDAASKIQWIIQNEPEVWAGTAKLLDIKDWLVHAMTGRFTTTPDCANLTWMLDNRKGREGWSPGLMKRVGANINQLPEIIQGDDTAGDLTPLAADALGLDAGIPVFGGSGDVCAATLGSGATRDGALNLHMGTSSWISGFFPDRRLSIPSNFATIASPANFHPLLIATQESAGGCLEWAQRAMSPEEATLDAFADEPVITERPAATPVFLPWLAGERVPVNDERLRGAFLGLSLAHNRSDLVQSVFEGVALNTRWAFEAVIKTPGALSSGDIPMVGGLAGHKPFCAVLASAIDRKLVVAEKPHAAGVRGAAAFAASGLGWASSPMDAIEKNPQTLMHEFHPVPSQVKYLDRRYELFRAASKAVMPWYHMLASS